jgi:hypothetical protein
VPFFDLEKLGCPQSIEIQSTCATKSKIVFHILDRAVVPAQDEQQGQSIGQGAAVLGRRLSAKTEL